MKKFIALVCLLQIFTGLAWGQTTTLSSSLNNIPTASTFTVGDSMVVVQGGIGKKASNVLVTGVLQPFDSDLIALAALSGTNVIYYRSAANVWTPVTIGANLTFVAGTLASTASGGTWGSITGTLSAQTDLQAALDAKLSLTGNASGLTGLTDAQIPATIARDSEVAAGYQPLDTDLTSIASLVTMGYGRSLLTATDAAALRTLAGLTIGVNVQAWNAGLDSLAAASGTNTVYYRSAANVWSPVSFGSGLSWTGGTLSATGGGGGSSIILDLLDDGANESGGVLEIATTGDTNNIFTEPTADKLLIAVGNAWPVAAQAQTGDSATNFFSAGTIEMVRGGLGADVAGFTGFVAINASNAVARTLTEGLAIDITNPTGSAGAPAFAFDPTELNGSRTFGDGSTDAIVWTFDRTTGTDPTITFNSGSIGFQSISLATALSPANGGTGLTALGTNVATFLGTPSGANLFAALTTKTGTGVPVFDTSPTFTTQITTPKVVWSGSVQDLSGTGSPEAVVTAPVGSVYRRTDGGAATSLYVKESGAGNTGWVAYGAPAGAGAPSTATYITQTPDGTLSAEQALNSLASGFMSVTTSTGVVASRTLTEGLAIDITSADGSGNPSFAFDPTELTGSRTFGDGSTDTIAWTINRATGTDPIITFNSGSVDFPALTESGNAVPNATDNLGFFASTTSAQINTVVSDNTGSNLLVFNTTPTIVTPNFTGAATWEDGTRQTFNPNGTAAGLNVGSQAGDPSTPINGDIWYDSANNSMDVRINGATVSLGSGALDIDALPLVTAASLDTDDVYAVSIDGTESKITTTEFQNWLQSLALTFTTINTTNLNATNLSVLDAVNQSHGLGFVVSSDLIANKTFTYAGAFNYTMTLTGDTSVTFPTSGTLYPVGGALGTPSSGTVTNLTGTASININGTVGATTPSTGVFTTLVAGNTTSLLLGTAGSAVGNVGFRNATSGTATLQPPTGALGAYNVTLPNAASTLPIYGQQVTYVGPTAARTVTYPDASFTVARTDAANTFTGVQTMTSPALTTANMLGAATWPDDVRQTFNPGSTVAGVNVGAQAGDPSTPTNGDLWYDSTNNTLDARINGATVSLGSGGGTVDDTAFASSWNGVTTAAPSKNAVYDWGHLFDTDDDGKVNVLDIAAGIPKTDSAGVVSLATAGTDYTTPSSTETMTNKTLTAPRYADLGFDADANGNELIIWDTVASAVNELTFANAASGSNPSFTASGGDSNIGINFTPKGTGTFRFLATASGPSSLYLFEDLDNGSNSAAIFAPSSMSADRALTLPDASDTLVGKATTDTFTNKTLDGSSTGNVLKFKSFPQFTSPLLVDGTNATIGTTSTAIGYGLVTFSNSVDEASNYAEWRILVPADWDTAVDPRVKVVDRLTGADTNTRQYSFQVASVASSASAAGTVGTKIDVNFSGDASGASGDAEISSTTTLTGWGAAVTPGQLMVIRVARDGDDGSDASTVNSMLLAFELEYGATQ